MYIAHISLQITNFNETVVLVARTNKAGDQMYPIKLLPTALTEPTLAARLAICAINI